MTIYIEVDGENATMQGTTKGDPVEAQARQGTAWRWSGRLGCFVLPRNLRRPTRNAAVKAMCATLRAHGREVVLTDTGAVQSEAERREASEQRLADRADRLEHRAEKRQAESDWVGERYGVASWTWIADRKDLAGWYPADVIAALKREVSP